MTTTTLEELRADFDALSNDQRDLAIVTLFCEIASLTYDERDRMTVASVAQMIRRAIDDARRAESDALEALRADSA